MRAVLVFLVCSRVIAAAIPISVVSLTSQVPWHVTLDNYALPPGTLPVAASSSQLFTGLATNNNAIGAGYNAAGDLFVLLNTGVGSPGPVLKFSAGVQSTVIASVDGFGFGAAMAIDASNNIFVVANDGSIVKYTAPGYAATTFAPNTYGFFGLAIDSTNQIVAVGLPVSDLELYRISQAGAVTTLNNNILPTAGAINGIAFDSSQNIYIAYPNAFGTAGAIGKFTSAGTLVNAAFASFVTGTNNYVVGLAFDPVGQHFYTSTQTFSTGANSKTWSVSMTGVVTQFASTAYPFGVESIAGPLPVAAPVTSHCRVFGQLPSTGIVCLARP